MTTHELARYLLKNTPDVPVLINGWGSDEGLGPFEVTGADVKGDDAVYLEHGEVTRKARKR